MKRILKWVLGIVVGVPMFLILIGLIYQQVGSIRDADFKSAKNAPGQMVEISPYSMHLDCDGLREPGSPVVVLQGGAPGWSFTWNELKSALSPNIRVCAYDRLGAGWSSNTDEPYSVGTTIERLTNLLETAGETGPYIPVGLSFGHVHSLQFAAHNRDSVSGIIVIDGGPPGRYSQLDPEALAYTQLGVSFIEWMPILTRVGLVRVLDYFP